MFGFSGSVYKNWCLNALKLSYLLNLCIFTASTQHVGLTKGDQTVVACISVGIAFITFVAIVACHACNYLRNTTFKSQQTFCCTKNEDGKKCDANKSEENEFYLNHGSKANLTTTVVDLHDICRTSTEQM